ncbi:MAG: hypothetical protein ACTHNQ_03630 [Microbacterium sp.]|uniref:hypothetical protein n=1 Tax=Microbacterium sp. TaxID=51671 RepID=UPI003F81086F
MTDPHPPHEQPVTPADPGYYAPPRADVEGPVSRPYEYVSAADRPDAPPAHAAPAHAAPAYATPAYAAPQYAPPGSPSTFAAPPAIAPHRGAPIVAPRDERPKGIAVTGFVLAIVGLVLALIPATAGFAILVMLVAFVVSIIGLTGSRGGGKGFAGTGLALSILGGLVAVVVAALQAFGAFGSRDLSSPPSSSDDYAQYEPVGSRFAAPGADGIPDDGVTFATPVALTVTETAFGAETDGGSSWFVVILDNTNSDYIFTDAEIRVRALDATGVEVAAASEYLTALQGRSAVVLHGVATTGAVATVEVTVPEASYATVSPASETGRITVTGMQPMADDRDNRTRVSGEAVGSFAADLWYTRVVVVARDGGGRIIGGQVAAVDRLPGDGSPAPFNGWFVPLVAADAAFEAYPTP